MLVPALYDAAWRKARSLLPGHRPLSDPFLWHLVYRLYVEHLPKLCRDDLIESHLRIVGPIAGQIARRRFPATFGMVDNPHAKDGHEDLIHELIATGNLGLFEAVEHFDPGLGAFSTIANFWIRKFIHEGDRAHGIFGREGLVTPCRLPRRHVATFPVGLTVSSSENRPDDGSDEFDLLDSDGRTSRKYLQRHIGNGGARFLWRDEGSHAVPRLKLPGHPNGKASDEVVCETERDFEKSRSGLARQLFP